MSFAHIRGQDTAVETLKRALSRGLVHHAYRFEGIDGVGKELTAVALAQALLCTCDSALPRAGTAGERLGCGRCEACRRTKERAAAEPATPLHPDFVYVARGFYPPETIGGKKETNEISVEQIRRVVLSRVSYAPHEGRAQVFVIRDAEQLSISAANAMLKTLEEPRPDTYFVLLTARADKLPDTIRSRSLPIRFAPLADDVVATLLTDAGVDRSRIDAIVELAGGSASAALGAANAEIGDRRERFVADVLGAVRAPGLAQAVSMSEALESDRHVLVDQLMALASELARHGRLEATANPAGALLAARRHQLVLDAIDSVERNGAAALAIQSLVASLKHGEQRRPGTKPPIVIPRR